jgi:hypothetical protein
LGCEHFRTSKGKWSSFRSLTCRTLTSWLWWTELLCFIEPFRSFCLIYAMPKLSCRSRPRPLKVSNISLMRCNYSVLRRNQWRSWSVTIETKVSNALYENLIVKPAVAPVRYLLYCRKSTESDELQALSIDSQEKEMMELATRQGLNVVEVRRESHSAKESGQRPVFQSVIQDIRAGKFNGLKR